MNYIDVEQMNEACTQEYNENYAHGGYCHEQSFRFGFQEGVEFAENEIVTQIINKACDWLNNEFYQNLSLAHFIDDFRKAMEE